MAAEECIVCPACFTTLAPIRAEAVEVHCPHCQHVWDPGDDLKQTVEHTPEAKRKSSRPGPP